MSDLEKYIFERKSCRKYIDEEISAEILDDIENFIQNTQGLNENIEFQYEILKRNQVKLKTPWKAPYYIAIYSKHYEDMGFIFQQVSLYLQSLSLGNCWVGMGEPKIKNDDFVILIAFGKSDDIKRSEKEFMRKELAEISDIEDFKLIPAKLAPSAINSQPWYFKHNGEYIDVYRVQQNFIKRKLLENLNKIDIGIALANLYVANMDTFEFKINPQSEDIKGYNYFGSIKL